ncbi:tannase/feruloyl esterase family alpha/beta hydrolase [Microbacterium elymi]|uniref:Tannase/feruloyl esterase family alpha/beta hydrolase n=1 Tax=Microbacterium elymi TaxID=2909587 RepID=A0ABY5NKW1_9MICO|nr:tannase/feruloyl esterase family alpha/beta hydrolase [Microbacterium elymi]UUT35711.1 tannase/feruloyl esterase family alpha/beta hydrolase [Microbacterium elymi]
MRRTAVIAALSAVLLTGGMINGWVAGAGPASAHGNSGHGPGHGTSAAITERACTGLGDASIGANKIGLPTTGATVTTATWVVDDGVGRCQVVGDILPVDSAAPPIEFQVNLPANWNHRAVQMGGGGYDGSLVTGLDAYALQPAGQKTPLEQGFVTLGSDGGHKGTGGFDSTFGLNDEALANYGTQSIKKTHDVAMALMKTAFRSTPKYFYFIGFSQGGHEAINAAGLYPKDYDGVVAGTPSYNVAMMHAGIGSVYRDALYSDGGAGWLNTAKTQLLVHAVYAACDPLDGLKDGVISNVTACQQTFNVTTLRLPGWGGCRGHVPLGCADQCGDEDREPAQHRVPDRGQQRGRRGADPVRRHLHGVHARLGGPAGQPRQRQGGLPVLGAERDRDQHRDAGSELRHAHFQPEPVGQPHPRGRKAAGQHERRPLGVRQAGRQDAPDHRTG